MKAATEVSAAVAKEFIWQGMWERSPNDLYPMAYAEQAMEFASDFDNVNVVISYDEAISMGMGGLVGVGMGSAKAMYRNL